MNSKQLYNLYVESLWDILKENDFSILENRTWYGKIIVYKNNEREKIADMLENSCSESTQINTLEELKKYAKEVELDAFNKSISSDLRIVVENGVMIEQEAVAHELNEKIILKFLTKVPDASFANIYDKVSLLLIRASDNYQFFWNIINHVKDTYGNEHAVGLFNHFPVYLTSFTKNSDLDKNIPKYIADINQFFGKNSHPYIYNFIKARAKQANASQIGSIALRDALISEYVGNNQLLEEYKDIVPSLKKYLETNEEGEFYYSPKNNVIQKTIDIEQFKAVASINISQNNEYSQLIIEFLAHYKQKDSRLVSFDTSMCRIKKDHVYLNFFIYSKPDNILPEQEFDKKLRSFVTMLGKEKPQSVYEVRQMIGKWWQADDLTNSLENRDLKNKEKLFEEKTINKNKI